MKKTLLLSALVLSFASVANAADAPEPTSGDFSTADIQWAGKAKVIPGSDITITGANGAIEPSDGTLNVNANGTFETATPVRLQSRLYYDMDGDGAKDIGDLFATNWTLNPAKPIIVTWGTNVVDGMNIEVEDLMAHKKLTDTSGSNGVSEVNLTVTNKTPTSTPAEDPRAELNVQASILATVA